MFCQIFLDLSQLRTAYPDLKRPSNQLADGRAQAQGCAVVATSQNSLRTVCLLCATLYPLIKLNTQSQTVHAVYLWYINGVAGR